MTTPENTAVPIVIYQSADGSIATEVRLEGETVWLSQKQMAELFDKDVRTINEHIINAFEEGELAREATIRNFRIVRQEGQRQVEREIEHYNLDVIISVGYRVKSKQGTQFRIWANSVLKSYLVQGYAHAWASAMDGAWVGTPKGCENLFEAKTCPPLTHFVQPPAFRIIHCTCSL